MRFPHGPPPSNTDYLVDFDSVPTHVSGADSRYDRRALRRKLKAAQHSSAQCRMMVQ